MTEYGESQFGELGEGGSFPDGPEARWGDPGLQNLERWLAEHGADPFIAQTTPLDIWVFQAYEVVPILGRSVPIALTAFDNLDGGYEVKAYIPSPEIDDPRELENTVSNLTQRFDHYTDYESGSVVSKEDGSYFLKGPGSETNLRYPAFSLEVVNIEAGESFESIIKDVAEQQRMDFIGIVGYDLEADLSTVMHPDDVQAFLNAPNIRTLCMKPSDVLGTDSERYIADFIMERWHGVP